MCDPVLLMVNDSTLRSSFFNRKGERVWRAKKEVCTVRHRPRATGSPFHFVWSKDEREKDKNANGSIKNKM